MKTRSLYLIWAILALTITFNACKKDNKSTGTTSEELQTQSDDQTQVSNETDAVADDVNAMLSNQASITGSSVTPGIKEGIATQDVKPVPQDLICDASVTIDTSTATCNITITYNGSNCAGTRTRTGVVVVSWAKGTHWRDKGAVVTVSIQNLKITRVRDSKSVTLNGTHTYTNASGGSLYSDVPKGTPVTHTVTSDDMSITFDNGAKRTWHIARQRVYSWVNQGYVITTTGLHTDGTTTGISEWGITRWGNTFAAQITQPLVIDMNCNWRLTQGEVKIVRPEVTTTITFGLDANGNPTTCPDGSYYFKLVWVAGKTYTFILPY